MSKVKWCGRNEEGNFKDVKISVGVVKMANIIVSGAFCSSFDSCRESSEKCSFSVSALLNSTYKFSQHTGNGK